MYRQGKLYTQVPIAVYDHDFPSLAKGVAIAHGLFDMARNLGYVTIGTSHDTSELAGDCLRSWWHKHGCKDYPQASSILLLCDCGGSNNARYYLFKEQLQALADSIGKEIRVAHYPPYTSKYNPIEHRLFPHLTRACQGVIFEEVETVKELMASATTRTGLRVFVNILDKVYETGKKAGKTFKEGMTIVFDKVLPQWNYTAVPSPA